MIATAPSEKEIRRLLLEMQGYKTDYSAHPKIAERVIAIASDVHVPYHDAALVAHFVKVAQASGAQAVVWLGDLVDNMMLSRYGNTDVRSTFRDQMEQAGAVIQATAACVQVQYWSIGNHEYRWMSKMGFHGDMDMFVRMAGVGDLIDSGRLIVSDDPTLLYSHGAEWMLTHPEFYSSTPLVVPGKLAERFAKNVISGHTHHWGMSTSASGRYTIIESGGLFNPALIEYTNRKVTAHRAWTPGFVLLNDGVPSLIRG